MQKETPQLEYSITPRSTVLAPGSVASPLKVPRGKGGAASVKTHPNNPEEHLLSGKTGQDLRVPVLNMRGKVLMPTRPQKARKLLEAGKAEIVGYSPFCIQLLYATGEAVQKLVLGIDAGFKYIGYSIVSVKEEVLAGETELRSDIKRLLENRRAYRRTKRARVWYRRPRFLNRGKEGWLAPSIRHKLNSHIKLIARLQAILPIAEVVVEVATFDPHKMQKPEIKGVEYQQGTLQGYNVREYLLEKWGRKCAYCHKKDLPLEIEHIIPKSRGGSNRVSNLTLSCHECNQRKGGQTAEEFGYPQIQRKAKTSLKGATFMNIVRWKLVNHFKCLWTYGYITKYWRIQEGLPKSHLNDASIIAGGKRTTIRAAYQTFQKQVRRQNRSLYKANILKGGKLKRNTVKEVNGYRRFDKVMYKEKECFIYALRSSGFFNLKTIEGEEVSESANWKKLKLIERARGVIEEVKRAIPPCAEVQGLLARA